MVEAEMAKTRQCKEAYRWRKPILLWYFVVVVDAAAIIIFCDRLRSVVLLANLSRPSFVKPETVHPRTTVERLEPTVH